LEGLLNDAQHDLSAIIKFLVVVVVKGSSSLCIWL